nr:PREDICTED: zinc finger protein 345 isoform X20 [Tribolium castaneum]|eukprot:XP_015834135.1 PREDICTED: zinc finger protein 345 isoform X20 [Tribolium castaneum]
MGSIENISELCRLCLVKDQVNVPIFEENATKEQTFVKINSCLPVKVSRDDSLPKKICDGCSCKLDMLYTFRNTSVDSEKQLLKWLNQAGLSCSQSAVKDPLASTKPEVTIKQETFEPTDSRDDLGLDTHSYIMQQQKLPYSQEFEFGEPSESNVGLMTDEPAPKKAKRAAALNKASVETDEDDLDAAMQITKAEDEDSDEIDQPEYVEAPSTSADDQPGPSGVNKTTVEAPSFDEIIELEIHSDQEESAKQHTCRACRQKFESYHLLRRHRYHHHSSKTMSHLCPHCGKLFKTKYQLQLHLEVHDNKLRHYCEVCNKYLKSTHLVRSHKLFHSVAGQKCPDCDIIYNFSSARAFYAHRRLHRTKEEFVCDTCGKAFKDKEGLKQHSRVHENRVLPCKQCDKVFKGRSGLNRHVAIVHEGKRCICEVCGKKLTTQQNLKEHMMVHTGDRPYKCNECGKTFITKQHWTLHQTSHTNEKLYQCAFCEEKFNSSSGYNLHVRRVHEKQKPFVCEVCSKGFATRGALGVHCKIHS